MNEKHVSVSQETCIGCGRCVTICPSQALVLAEKKAVYEADFCIECGHCQAVCPTGSVSVSTVVPDWWKLEHFSWSGRFVPPGKSDLDGLLSAMASRRSTRMFRSDPLPRELLMDLVRIGTMAPSGTNSQKWVFHLLPDRDSVVAAGQHVARFFKKLNAMSEKRLARWVSRTFLKGDPLGIYYRDYHDAVEAAMAEWDSGGRDRLFWGAPAVLFVGSARGASCPSEDALLATQNILLAAHAAGLGTCLIGFAVEALKNDKTLAGRLGIPRGQRIHAVIAVGYADDPYRKFTGRRVPEWSILKPAPLP